MSVKVLASPLGAKGADWQDMLIEAVRRRPVLWDKSHIDFKDECGIKRNNWVDMAKEMMLAG